MMDYLAGAEVPQQEGWESSPWMCKLRNLLGFESGSLAFAHPGVLEG